MPAGFFSKAMLRSDGPKIASAAPRCGACGLYKHCESPKMPVSGEGRMGILIVGEAPGENEDRENTQFIGKAGQELKGHLKAVGVRMRRDCWLTNSLICRPEDNRTPTEKEINYCRPNLIRTIRELNPRIIIPVGDAACRSVIGFAWDGKYEGLARWVGWRIPSRKPNCWICPTWHPSYVMRCAEARQPVVPLLFRKHLKAAVACTDRPWGPQGAPDDRAKIEIITNPRQAARRIENLMLLGDFPFAFDYETDRLKPDADDAEIICCSICFEGKTTIVFPWTNRIRKVMKRLLESPAPKVGSNIKFENRWSKRFGIRVRNWRYCCMNGAHVLDNRKKITSIKFQAYVHRGAPVWNKHIEKYLKADTASAKNRIREVEPKELYLYCGLDSLYEYQVAEIHCKELGIQL